MNEMYDQGVVGLASSKDLLHIQRHNSPTAPLAYLLAVVRLKSNYMFQLLHINIQLLPQTQIFQPHHA